MFHTLFFASAFSMVCFAQSTDQSADRFSQLLRGESPSATPGGLATGFAVSARSGATGQALTASLGGQVSAKAAAKAALRQIAPYFDKKPVLQSAVGDPKDQQLEVFFRAGYQGAAVRGMMAVTAQNGTAQAAVFFDREDLFGRSFPVLAKQTAAALPRAQGGAPQGPQGPPQLIRTRFASGSIGLAPGWRIGDSYKGGVDVSGPNGEILSLGIGVPVLPRSPYSGPYQAPWPALQMYFNSSNKGALSRGEMSLRLLEQTPQPFPNGQGAWISFEGVRQGRPFRGFALVETSPMKSDLGTWFYYNSMALANADVFARQFPTMLAMWKSWGVNQEVYKERMDSVIRSMHSIMQMMAEVEDYKVKSFENTNYGWTETFRGVTMIQEIATKTRWEVKTDDAQWIVDELNSQGYNFRIVPTNDLIWDLSGR